MTIQQDRSSTGIVGWYKAFTKKYSIWLFLIVIPTILIPVVGIGYLLALPPEVRNAKVTRPERVVQEEEKEYDDDITACDIHRFVSSSMTYAAKYPDEVEFPDCTTALLSPSGKDEYRIIGYIIAPNAFGVKDRINYSMELRYLGGYSGDPENWEVIGEPTVY